MLMQIKKVFNNNVLLASDGASEVVVMGKGIGFQKKVDDMVEEERIEKVFVLKDKETLSIFSSLYKDLPPQLIDSVLAIIQLAEEKLQQSFQSNLYITIADHLSFALERHEKGLDIKNPLSYEVKKFYPNEYEVGRLALQLIYERMNVLLSEDEATAIALHIVSAEKEGSLFERTLQITKIVQDVMNIIRMHFGVELDESDISYNRLVTHLQYFAQRIVTRTIQGSNDTFLYEQVQANYPQSFACTEKIKTYVEQTYDFAVGRDEQVYLTLHVQKIIFK